MDRPIDRRTVIGAGAAALAAAVSGTASAKGPAAPPQASQRPKKSVMFDMLPGGMELDARFRLARDIGFAAVEAPPIATEAEAAAMRRGAEAAGLRIQSVIYGGWDAPLSSPDPAVVRRGIDHASHALQSARWMGADDILLVPGIVTATTRYKDCWERTQRNVRALLPTAENLGVMICIEEVWNDFLLSPLEFARYIDDFRHPLVHSYFDVGNVVAWGWPQDWIRTLGHRIRKVHLKDYKRDTHQFVNLGDGDVDWPEVRKAFSEVGYTGFMNTELPGGNEAYLRDVSRRVDRLLLGE